MATKWPESVRTSGKLLVWANQTAKAGWSVALERAIKEFNRATHTRKLALRFEPGLGNPVLWVCPEAGTVFRDREVEARVRVSDRLSVAMDERKIESVLPL